MHELRTASVWTMSKEAIQAVVHELESLPESDQQRVLTFLTKLRQQRRAARATAPGNPPTLCVKNGLLVFTGQLEGLDRDWVRFVRDEHDEELMQAALGRTTCA
jgi:hypothetical protein